MILVIDNYDSFTYNLVQLLGRVMHHIEVRRNDAVDIAAIEALRPKGILLSPGPGRPENAGVTEAVIGRFAGMIPVLGVCLGHQAIGRVFGGKVVHAPELMHGRTSAVHHDGKTLYRGISGGFAATRYHSLVVAPESVPAELEVSAWTEDGVVMGLRHRSFAVEGVQFHPESILTEHGETMMRNWLEMIL
jgi:anthranilate synthase/aminodeoxychorismate synthase-like glutamine amidotransferase